MAAFLFCWPDGDLAKTPIKLPKCGGPGIAVMDYPNKGICFAPDGLRCMVPGRERLAVSRLGPFYETMPGGSRTIFSNNKKEADVERITCYASIEGPETYELDGIIWKTGRNKQ